MELPHPLARPTVEGPGAVHETDVAAGKSAFVLVEDSKDGSVSWRTYLFYMKMGGHVFCVVVVLLFASCQLALMSSDFWTGMWAEAADQNEEFYPLIFAVLTFTVTVLAFLRSVTFYFTALRSTTTLHNKATSILETLRREDPLVWGRMMSFLWPGETVQIAKLPCSSMRCFFQHDQQNKQSITAAFRSNQQGFL